ncbi:MAG: hypothetical protein L3J52_08640, partial [Proteobacteria bacterium]|nr:hypothetical protein [Pseudomonadota bacterium]
MKKFIISIALTFSLLNNINSSVAAESGPTSPDDSGNYMVSSQLYDAIESWYSGYSQTMPLVTFVLESNDNLFMQWMGEIEQQLPLETLNDYFITNFPNDYQEAKQALGRIELESFVYYLQARNPALFSIWQSAQLESRQLSLKQFLRHQEPDLLAEWNESVQSPKVNRYGSFSQLLTRETYSNELKTEGLRLLDKIQDRGGEDSDCVCSIVSAFQALPVDRETDTDLHEVYKNNGTLKEHIRFDEAAKGAVHSGDLTRYIKSGLNTADFSRANHVTLRASILCLGANNDECDTGICTGEMDLQAEYGSKVYVKTDVSGVWSKASVSLAADTVKLIYDPPGTVTEQVLFNKGLAVEREQKTTWNEDAFMSLLEGTLGIVTLIATDGASIADLEFNMLDKTVSGILGLISHSGNGSGVVNKTFYANYDTATTAPILMESGKSYRIELSSLGRVFGRGWGAETWSWAKYNSSSWFVSAIKNYSCDEGVIPPGRAGFWSYSSEGGPHSNNTLAHNVNSFLYTELGYTGDATTGNSTGEILMPNPQPPVVNCSVSPSMGMGSVTPTLNA